MGGNNFTILPDNGIPYSYNQRAIPYLENAKARRLGTFDNNLYFDSIDAIRSNNLGTMNTLLSNNGKDIISQVQFDDMVARYSYLTREGVDWERTKRNGSEVSDRWHLSPEMVSQLTGQYREAFEEDWHKILEDQKKLESLKEEYAGYLEKQKQGLYGQEYEAKKDIQGNCYLYGVDVDHAKRTDMNGLYEMDSRYNDFGPILFRELGYTFEIPEEDIKNMTPAEYANLMGPIWEISQKYETRADDLEDIRTVITILSAFSMYVGVEGVASAVAFDTGLDTADTAVSIISGDRAGTILGILSIALPALMDDAAKGGKLAAKDLSNGIEGLSEVERVKLDKALEVEGITDIRKLDVDQEVLTIYSKETTYEIRMMDEVVEGKGNFESRFGDVLATNGITIEEFDFLKLKDISTLTDTEKAMLKNIRESVPFPNSDTVLQKVIPSSDIEKYLDGTYTEVVDRAQLFEVSKDGNVILRSTDINDIQNGFTACEAFSYKGLDNDVVCVKYVTRSEVEEYYKIKTKAIFV